MDEDWMEISDIAHRRRVQNRLAQRKHRTKNQMAQPGSSSDRGLNSRDQPSLTRNPSALMTGADLSASSRGEEPICVTEAQSGQAFHTETFDSFAVDDISPTSQPNVTAGLCVGPEHGDGRIDSVSATAGGVPDCWFDGGQFMPHSSVSVQNKTAMTTMAAPDEFAAPTDPLGQGIHVGYGGYCAADGSSRGGHAASWPPRAQVNSSEWQQPALVSHGSGQIGQFAQSQQPQSVARNRGQTSPQRTSNLRGIENRSDNNDSDHLLRQTERPSQTRASTPRRSNSGMTTTTMYPSNQRRQSIPGQQRPTGPSTSSLLREHGIDLRQILMSSARHTMPPTPAPSRRSPLTHAERQAEVEIVVPQYQQQGMNMESSRGQYGQGGYEEGYEHIAGSRVSKVVVIYLEE